MELPIAFENRMKALLGAEYEAFYHALVHEDAVKGLRVNPKKTGADAFAAAAPFALEPISYVSGGFFVSEEAQAGKHPYHHAGAYYMQDPGAMATVAALPREVLERDDLRVLDLCAAPGGKTTQLAAAIESRGGAVLANEYNAARSRVLAGNVERMGLGNVCVTNLDSKYLAAWYQAYFDLVVVDAPCSGEGMFRKAVPAIEEWSLGNVSLCAKRQAEILENAARCVRAGGYLLYSTCTYSIEENEATVAAFLEQHPEFSLRPCDAAVAAHTANGVDAANGRFPLSLCRRFYPHLSRGEGQFLALMQREDAGQVAKFDAKDAFLPLSKVDRTVVTDFCREALGEALGAAETGGICLCGGNVVCFVPHERLGFPLPPFGVVAAGVMLGEVRKGRLQPHHHFFAAYGDRMARQVVLAPSEARVARYLAGEEIEIEGVRNGTAAVMLRLGEGAISLGGGKAVDGKFKNYYPKGLRVRR